MSMTKSNLISPAEFVGTENYTHLAEDNRLPSILKYTAQLALNRMGIMAILPLIVGILMGLQGRIGRSINRVILSILIVVVSPVALTALWSVYWGSRWGTQPSPLWPPPDSQMLSSPDGARNSVMTLDTMITTVIAIVICGSAYMAIMRGRRAGKLTIQAFVGIWIIGVLVAGGSAVMTFIAPFILTGGGPANATTTLMLYMYRVGFQNFQFGYATALGTFLIIGGLITGLIVGLVLVIFRLRIQYVSSDETPSWGKYLLVASIPLVLLIGYPVLSLFLWGNGLVESNGGFSGVLEGVNWNQALSNSTAPLMTIWLIQIPITYLAGLSLGFLRPFGRIGSNILFVLFLVMLFIPAEALHNVWFTQVKDAGLLNTLDATTLPWMISAGALIVFKLFFDGAYEKYSKAGTGEESTTNRFVMTVLLPSLPIIVLVGAVVSFMSVQAFIWPLLVVQQQDLYPLTVQIAQVRGALSGNNLPLVGLAMTLIRNPGIIFAVVFAVLQILVVDRLAILGGREQSS
jgi:multiple sugar transport system permease protein